MAVTLLTTGVSNVITQNVIYALPSVSVFLQASVAVETSLDNSTYVLVAASTTGIETAALFVRCTTANSIVSIKRRA